MNDLDHELESSLPPIEFANLPNSLHSDEPAALSKREKFVGFFLGEKLFGISADKVAEIVQPPPVTPLPNAPHTLLGIAAVRGEIVAVVNIKNLLNEGISRSEGKAKLIILPAGKKETRIAFPVDKIHEVVMIAENEVEPCDYDAGSHIVGCSSQESGVYHLICTDNLSGALELK